MQIIPVTLEIRVRLYCKHDVKIAFRPTRATSIAFALITDPRSIFHASRHSDANGVTAVGKTGAVALQTRTSDHLSRTVTDRAGTRYREEALLVTDLTPTRTLFAGFGPASRRSPASATFGANFSAADLYIRLFSEDSFFKLDGEIVANVAAALLAPTTAAAADVEHLAEEVPEDITHIGVGEAFKTCTGSAHARVPVTIIGSTFLRIGQYLV